MKTTSTLAFSCFNFDSRDYIDRMPDEPIPGQLNAAERQLITDRILSARKKPECVLEVGTWRGGGSTLHILRALQQNGRGHLWGIEANASIYAEMIENIRKAIPDAAERFTPLLGFSHEIIPRWLNEQKIACVDFVFLDGGNNPNEQILEFKMLEEVIPVGGCLMAHDAKTRKGKWLVPYMRCLDNWDCVLHDTGIEGLFEAVKTAGQPSNESLRQAEQTLSRLKNSPQELVARLIPHFLRHLLAHHILPRRLVRLLVEGRKDAA